LPEPSPRDATDMAAPLICRAIFEEVCVLANGDVVCSCADPAGLRVYGNIRQQTLPEILAGPMYRELRSWQLESKPDRWCPAIGEACPLRVHRATPFDTVEGHLPRMLQLEPTSHCNLSCPACPVTNFQADHRYTADRTSTLELAEMTAIFEQLPSLRKLLLYNYGEAFLHAHAIELLRWLRRNRREIEIHVSTNGLALTPARLKTIVGEGLVDRMLFAIDGARPESYARYRVGGKLEKALGAMRNMVAEAEASGLRDRFEIWWQYILFEWNDSDEELAEAQEIAAEIGVPIEWVVTHTEGASKKYGPESDALARLVGAEKMFRALSCDLKGAEIVRQRGVESRKHRADIKPASESLRSPTDARLILPVVVRHEGELRWGGDDLGRYRLGIKLFDAQGGFLAELRGVQLPTGIDPGCRLTLFPEVELPAQSGDYRLMLDLVEEGVCWFSERGSSPAIVSLATGEETEEGGIPRADLIDPMLRALEASARRVDLGEARTKLEKGAAIEDLLLLLRSRGVLDLPEELEVRSSLGDALVPAIAVAVAPAS